MRTVRIVDSKLNVGKKDYVNLHENLMKCDNMLEVKKLFNEFNECNNISKNTYHQGISIYENFLYIITNKITKKKYIGETSNLISRMYSYSRLEAPTQEFKKDFIDYGLKNFSLFVKFSKNRKQEEKKTIDKYKDNCYNVVYTEKSKRSNLIRTYTLGKMKFTSKQTIRNYCRKLLDSYQPGQEIELTSDDGIFATDMIKLHENYDGFFGYSDFIKLTVIRDNESDAWGLGNYNIFNFTYKNRANKITNWGFSTNKIIKRL